MKKYRIYDYNSETDIEQDLTEKDYINFLETCFRHCASCAFIVHDYKYLKPAFVIPELEKYRIPVADYVINAYSHYGFESELRINHHGHHEIRHYKLCTESCALIRCVTNTLFSWLCDSDFQNPEDLMFFRDDGTVFFDSVMHEGYATVYVKDNEDISDLLLNPYWKEI